MFVTPQKVRQADSMDLFNNLQEFVDNLRKKYGFPTSKRDNFRCLFLLRLISSENMTCYKL